MSDATEANGADGAGSGSNGSSTELGGAKRLSTSGASPPTLDNNRALAGIEIFFYIFEDPDYFDKDHKKCVMASTPLFVLAMFFQQFINLLIIGGTVALCMSTVSRYDGRLPRTSFRSSNEEWGIFWDKFEIVCVVAFSFDFFARLFGALHRGEFSVFRKQILNWVDLVAIAPFYLEKAAMGSGVDLRFVRVIRLVRIIRAMRSPRFLSMSMVVLEIVKISAPALSIPVFFMHLAMVFFSCIMYYTERGIHFYHCTDAEGTPLQPIIEKIDEKWRQCSEDNPAYGQVWVRTELYDGTILASAADGNVIGDGITFNSIPDTFWWNMVTFCTVGYGDMYPLTTRGRVINGLAIMMGVFFLAMPLSIIGSAFVGAWGNLVYKEEIIETRQLQREHKEWEVDVEALHAFQDTMHNDLDRLIHHVEDLKKLDSDGVAGQQWDHRKTELIQMLEEIDKCWAFYEDSKREVDIDID